MNEKEIEELRQIFLSRSSVELAVMQKLSTEILKERIEKKQAIEYELTQTDKGSYVNCVECGSSVHSSFALKIGIELFCSRKCVMTCQAYRKKMKEANFKGYYPEL